MALCDCRQQYQHIKSGPAGLYMPHYITIARERGRLKETEEERVRKEVYVSGIIYRLFLLPTAKCTISILTVSQLSGLDQPVSIQLSQATELMPSDFRWVQRLTCYYQITNDESQDMRV